MKHTSQQLKGMSDFDKGLLLCNLLGLSVRKEQFLNYCDRDPNVVLLHGAESFNISNWNDIMPLAIKYGIGTLSEDGEIYGATTNTFLHYTSFPDAHAISFTSGKPQRDIACCLIMLLEDNL